MEPGTIYIEVPTRLFLDGATPSIESYRCIFYEIDNEYKNIAIGECTYQVLHLSKLCEEDYIDIIDEDMDRMDIFSSIFDWNMDYRDEFIESINDDDLIETDFCPGFVYLERFSIYPSYTNINKNIGLECMKKLLYYLSTTYYELIALEPVPYKYIENKGRENIKIVNNKVQMLRWYWSLCGFRKIKDSNHMFTTYNDIMEPIEYEKLANYEGISNF